MLTWIILVPLGAYLALVLLVYLTQHRMVYFPTREIEATPRDAGLAYEDVELVAADGVKLSAWFVPAGPDAPVVLLCHGNGGNIGHRVESVRILHDLGLSVLLFDYRGYGQSEGRPTEAGTYLDADAAWNYLTRTRGVRPSDVIVQGRSLGAAVAAHLAAEQTPRALILESAFTSMPDLGRQLYPFLPVRLLCRFRYDTLQAVRAVRCAVLVVHSPQDDIVPYDHGRRIYEAANEPKQFLQITGTHNDGIFVSGRLYTEGLEGFLDACRPKP